MLHEIGLVWQQLGDEGQGIVAGAVASVLVALIQWRWPGLSIIPNQVKRGVIAVMTGLATLGLTGDWGSAFVAVVSVFTTYHLATGG